MTHVTPALRVFIDVTYTHTYNTHVHTRTHRHTHTGDGDRPADVPAGAADAPSAALAQLCAAAAEPAQRQGVAEAVRIVPRLRLLLTPLLLPLTATTTRNDNFRLLLAAYGLLAAAYGKSFSLPPGWTSSARATWRTRAKPS